MVTVVSFDCAKYFVIAISSSTASSYFIMGLAESKNFVTVTSLEAWSRNLVTVTSRNLLTDVSLAAANCVITFYILFRVEKWNFYIAKLL